MDLKELSKPLTIDQIDFRVQSINKGGFATILAYKDARADMQRLDDVVGPLNWKREHSRDNHNCTVSIWNEFTAQWVGKEDTGTESAAEAQKGLASDSFKRACFNWGIGRELYDYPLVQVKLNADEFTLDGNRAKATWKLKVRDWNWTSEFADGRVVFLSAEDNGKSRFVYYGETDSMIATAQAMDVALESDDWSGAVELWEECSRGEHFVIARAPSNGGHINTQNLKKLKSTEFRLALNEARGISV